MLALGLVIVYGILRLVNFAYGELIMIGGYTLYLLTGFTLFPGCSSLSWPSSSPCSPAWGPSW